MSKARIDQLVAALRDGGMPARTEHTGGGVFCAQLDLDDGTCLSIGDTEEGGHGWDRLTVEMGELVEETPEHYGTLEGGYDVRTVAGEIRRLLAARCWRVTE